MKQHIRKSLEKTKHQANSERQYREKIFEFLRVAPTSILCFLSGNLKKCFQSLCLQDSCHVSTTEIIGYHFKIVI